MGPVGGLVVMVGLTLVGLMATVVAYANGYEWLGLLLGVATFFGPVTLYGRRFGDRSGVDPSQWDDPGMM